MMDWRSVVALAALIGGCLTSAVFASDGVVNGGKYTSSSTNYVPSFYHKQMADQFLSGYQQELYESLVYGACPGMYVCDCINTLQGQAVIGHGHYYHEYERVCVEVNDYTQPKPNS